MVAASRLSVSSFKHGAGVLPRRNPRSYSSMEFKSQEPPLARPHARLRYHEHTRPVKQWGLKWMKPLGLGFAQ